MQGAVKKSGSKASVRLKIYAYHTESIVSIIWDSIGATFRDPLNVPYHCQQASVALTLLLPAMNCCPPSSLSSPSQSGVTMVRPLERVLVNSYGCNKEYFASNDGKRSELFGLVAATLLSKS